LYPIPVEGKDLFYVISMNNNICTSTIFSSTELAINMSNAKFINLNKTVIQYPIFRRIPTIPLTSFTDASDAESLTSITSAMSNIGIHSDEDFPIKIGQQQQVKINSVCLFIKDGKGKSYLCDINGRIEEATNESMNRVLQNPGWVIELNKGTIPSILTSKLIELKVNPLKFINHFRSGFKSVSRKSISLVEAQDAETDPISFNKSDYFVIPNYEETSSCTIPSWAVLQILKLGMTFPDSNYEITESYLPVIFGENFKQNSIVIERDTVRSVNNFSSSTTQSFNLKDLQNTAIKDKLVAKPIKDEFKPFSANVTPKDFQGKKTTLSEWFSSTPTEISDVSKSLGVIKSVKFAIDSGKHDAISILKLINAEFKLNMSKIDVQHVLYNNKAIFYKVGNEWHYLKSESDIIW